LDWTEGLDKAVSPGEKWEKRLNIPADMEYDAFLLTFSGCGLI